MAEDEVTFSKFGKRYSKKKVRGLDKEFHRELVQMRKTRGNRFCADCGSDDSTWASVNLGVFLCIHCAQIHRSLGSHISKVKSTMGTYLWHPDEMECMRTLGNDKARRIYGGTVMTPTTRDNSLVRAKYTQKIVRIPTEQAKHSHVSREHAIASGSTATLAKADEEVDLIRFDSVEETGSGRKEVDFFDEWLKAC